MIPGAFSALFVKKKEPLVYAEPINEPGANCSATYRSPQTKDALIGTPEAKLTNL